MSTIQDFENAPVGATATAPNGSLALKTGRREFEWSTYDSYGGYYGARRSADMGSFTLNPTAPTTAREAFDLTWSLAHEVKEGQVIPKGMRYVRLYESGDLATFISNENWTPRDKDKVRTQDPLPDPEPDWLDAPAVLADCDCNAGERTVHVNYSEIAWTCTDCDNPINPEDMKNVTPLYPKEG